MATTNPAIQRIAPKRQTLDEAYAPPANFLEIEVTNPITHGVGKTRYSDYEIKMRTNLPVFKLKESNIRRRYSDFEWLRYELERDSKIVVPSLPGKAIKRLMPFRQDDGIFEETFIEERRKGLEQFINKVAGHPLAQNEKCLHMFLQEPNLHDKSKKRLKLKKKNSNARKLPTSAIDEAVHAEETKPDESPTVTTEEAGLVANDEQDKRESDDEDVVVGKVAAVEGENEDNDNNENAEKQAKEETDNAHNEEIESSDAMEKREHAVEMGVSDDQSISAAPPSLSPAKQPDTVLRKAMSPQSTPTPVRTGPVVPDELQHKQLLAVVIQRTDRLKTKIYIEHPKVTVQLVDADTGQYLKGSTRFRGIPGMDSKSNDIKPLSTKEFNLLDGNDFYPEWNEMLLLPIEVSRINDSASKALLLFQLMDHIDAPATANEPAKSTPICIAWAYLTIVAKNGNSNVGTKLRLQLYRAPKKSRLGVEDPKEVYYWWRTSNRRVKYPSSLHIRTKAVLPNTPTNTNLSRVPSGSFHSTHNESSQDIARSVENLSSLPGDGPSAGVEEETVVWSKYPGEPFRVPQEKLMTISRSRYGCITVSFAPNGRWLACATQSVLSYPVNIHTIPKGRLHVSLCGHLQLVYCISWKWDSTMLVTTSADCTARIWRTLNGSCLHVLAHSTFVYAAVFHPQDERCVVTAAMDKTIRLWQIAEDLEPLLVQSICEHQGSVNCLSLSGDRKRLVSADSTGGIKLWSCSLVTAPADDDHPNNSQASIQFLRNVHNEELTGSVINNVCLTNDNRILVVVKRDGQITAIDLRSSAVKYRMPVHVDNLHIRADCSPDGRWLYCGNHTGQLLVYDMHTGKKVHEYVDACESDQIAVSVSVHPLEHMIAIGYIGDSAPVVVYKRNPSHDDDEMMKVAQTPVEKRDTFDINTDIKQLLEKHKQLTANQKIQDIFNRVEQSMTKK